MNLTAFKQTISNIWSFIFPPILTIFILWIFGYFILGQKLHAPFEYFINNLTPLIQNQETRNTLGRFGLIELAPVITLFAVISLLFITNVTIRFIGNLMPPHLIYNPDNLFLKIDNSDRLARIWLYFENIDNFGSLRTFIQVRSYKAEKELNHRLLGVSSWESNAAKYNVSFSVTKFMILWLFILSILGFIYGASIKLVLFRSVIAILVLFFMAVFFISKFYFATEQLAHSQLIAVDSVVIAEVDKGIIEKKINDYRKNIKKEKDFYKAKNWWEIRLIDTDYYKWIARTFLKFEIL